MNNYKLGSLFDGSGGFPLAGTLCGIEPCWAAEVEPYPIAVTRSRFPKMKHLGDISKVNGGQIEPVDIITFGSPCQDLSVAGKQAGLKHKDNGDEETTRSGLFMEAVRIIKEMRSATNGKYPSFALWENVPEAFSSNKGEDFRTVLEELIKVVEPSASMPDVPKSGWAYADSFVGDGWSLAWRVFDAQYWGVPQRRRRIYLVADLGGECAREVLFEREGLRGYFAQGRTPWQAAPADAQGSTGADDREGERAVGADGHGGRQLDAVGLDVYNQALTADKSKTLTVKGDTDHIPSVVLMPQVFENHSQDSRYRGPLDVSPMLPAQMGTGGNNQPFVVEPKDPVYCLQGNGIDRADTAGCNGKGVREDVCYTLNTIDRPAVAYGLDRASFNQGRNAKFDFTVSEEQQPTLTARGPGAVCCTTGSFMQATEEVSPTLMARDWKDPTVVCANYIVRRLTPTECARLQGFADWWGVVEQKDTLTEEEYRFWLEVRNTHARINGKPEKDYTEKQMLTWYNKLWTDSAEYKMWGNGIALPTALYCMQGIVDALDQQEDDSWMN